MIEYFRNLCNNLVAQGKDGAQILDASIRPYLSKVFCHY